MRLLGIATVVVLLLLSIAGLLLLIPAVQTQVAAKLATMASESTGADIRIGRFSLGLDGAVELGQVYVGDLHGDTLFVVDDLRVKGLRVRTGIRLVQFSTLELRGARFALATSKGDVHSNLTNLLDRLASSDTTSAGPDWTIRCARFLITDLHFSFHNANSEVEPFGVDFEHIDIPDARVQGSGLSVIGDSIHTHLRHLSLSERSGLRVNELSGSTSVSGKGVAVEHMKLVSPYTDLRGKLSMGCEGWADFNEFTSKVALRLDLDSSKLDMADIAWFAPELEGIRFPMTLSGKVRGTIAELKGRKLKVGFGERSFFSGSAELSGLPEISNTFMLLDVDELNATQDDLQKVPVPPFTSKQLLQLPEEVDLLGTIDFAGRFTGFLHAFTAQGKSNTALGDLRTDISYERDTVTHRVLLSGRAGTDSFQLGRLLGVSTIGPMAASVRLKASGSSLRAMKVDLEGDFPLITINGRAVTGITANGHIEKNLFNGELHANSEVLQLDFKGLADLRRRWPQVDFTAKVHHANLRALGFVDKPGYNALNVDVTAQGRLSPDSLLGRLELKGISYCDEDGEHDLGDVVVVSDRNSGVNTLRLDADFAEAEVVGSFLPTKLPTAISHVIYSVFPSLSEEVIYKHNEQVFSYTVRTRRTKELLDLLVPGLALDSGARINGSFSTRTFDLDLTAFVPKVSYGTVTVDSLELIADKTLDLLAFSARSPRQQYKDSLWFGGTAVTGKAYQDELEIELGWTTSNSGTNGDLELLGEVRGPSAISLDLLPSSLYFGRGTWTTATPTHIAIDSSTVVIDSLVLANEGQRLAFGGTVAKDPEKALAFHLLDVDLLNLEPLFEGPILKGILNGTGTIHDLYGAPYVDSRLEMDSIAVNDIPVGDIRFAASWLEGQGALDLNGELTRGPIKALDFTGRLGVKGDNELAMVLKMDQFDLTLVNPYLPEGISDLGGHVTGNVALTGTLERPELNGRVDVRNAGLRIDYLNTRYTFSNTVNIAPDMFTLDHAIVHDEEGHTGKMGATIIHDRLSNWNYDLWGSMTNMLVLNTTEDLNGLYYGKAYGTGDFGVSGYQGSLEITVDATTAPGTDIHFPVGGSTEVSPIGFVQFNDADSLKEEELVDLTGVSLDMDIDVTPDAKLELIFDPTVGDIMAGRGRGNIKMGVTSMGEFSMTGQVEVTEGDYLFTLRNVVNKRFQVIPGGRIVWYGDPFDAQLDLQAVYKLRAPLYDIVPPAERTDAYKKRVPVEVIMALRDKLMNPEIGFQVRLPSVDEGIKAQVASVLSTEQERNRQVFALIVLNKFLQPPVYAGAGSPTGTGNVAGTTTSELLSNQVSNWLSGLSNDFDLGVNYRPGDNITQDELEVAVSTQLFNERLLLSTNVGVQYGANAANSNSLIGDFQLEYLLTDDGKLRAKAFSVTNDRNLNQADQAPTTQGAGLAYRVEFDTWKEFWQKMGNIFRKPENDRVFD